MSGLFAEKYKDLMEVAAAHSEAYRRAAPYPNIVFDNFFDEEMLREVAEEFPDLSKRQAQKFNTAREVKLAGRGERYFGDKTRRLMRTLNSEPFLNFLQELTGISEPLIGDPYFDGGGQHEIKPGGWLKIHADFNKHPRFELDRRLNVLVYLNEDWHEEYGGHFEMWDEKMTGCQKRVLPLFNRLVIFSTTDFSYHGHPDKLRCPEGRSRRSLALYYYSHGRPAEEINTHLGKHSTLFQQRQGHEADAQMFEKSRTRRKLEQVVKRWAPPAVVDGLRSIVKR